MPSISKLSSKLPQVENRSADGKERQNFFISSAFSEAGGHAQLVLYLPQALRAHARSVSSVKGSKSVLTTAASFTALKFVRKFVKTHSPHKLVRKVRIARKIERFAFFCNFNRLRFQYGIRQHKL